MLLLAGDGLPQIARNSQKLLLGMTSHRLHRFTQMVWVRKILPQISQNSQNLLLGITSHRLHRSTQMLLISGWCTSCLVGALETSAPPEVCIREICGRIFSAEGSVKIREICGSLFPSNRFCADPLSMLISKCFDHYFHFKLRFYIQG